ncbi:hypothetical protein ACFQS7_22615 [Dankookia sp. GCM10030260]|uniref:hypothetical protein n=1 Tax=Dankookia sp. GCM10030260 TaxID=3273390 RepID=UPI00360AC418
MFDAITSHIGRNLWLWTVIGLAVSLLGIIARNSLGNGFYLGEIISFAAMFAGITLILISQKGMAHASDDEAA